VNESQLFAVFSSFGTILACQVLRDKQNVTKRMAHVNFYEPDAKQKAINGLNKRTFPGIEGSPLLSVDHFQAHPGQFKQHTNLIVSGLPYGM